MKITASRITAVAVALVAMVLPVHSENTVTYTATYDYSRLTTGTDTLCGATYSTVHYEGLFNGGAPGSPSLPVDFIRFSVPYNATNFTVTATNVPGETVTIGVGYPVYPCLESGSTGVSHSLTLPVTGYSSGTSYPAQQAHVVHEGFLAGENHIVTVEVSPCTYTHTPDGRLTDAVTVNKAIVLTLGYELDGRGPVPMCLVTRRDTTLRNKGFEQACALVVNPGDVRSNSPSPSLRDEGYYPPGPDPDVEDPVTYIVVATPESKRPMRRLAALRRQKGIPVKVVTVTEAVTDPLAGQGDVIEYGGQPYLTFTDNAGKLRQYLRENYYYNGTEYVLLAGTDVPVRDMLGGYSDMYYSGLTEDWNYSTYIENYAELYVGRLLGTECRQFDNYTDKLLRYELNPGNGSLSYLKKALATEGTGHFCDGRSSYLSPTFTTVTLLSPDQDDTEVTGSDLVGLENTVRYGLMTTFNEGFPTGFSVYGEDENHVSHYLWALDSVKTAPGITDIETGNGLNLMDNRLYPMVQLSFLGQTMPYTSVTGYGTCMSLGESFTTGKDYGGPAYLGLTYPANADNASAEALHFLSKLVGGQTVLGRTLGETKSLLPANTYNPSYSKADVVLFSNLLGDPALDVWTDLPQTYSNITVSRTDNSVTVTGLPSGTTKVAYHSNDGTTGLQSCSSSSVTLSGVSPNSTIMLYRHDYIPYIAPLILQNTDLANPQYVFAGKVRAGYNVDSGRTHGDVTVKSGADYEIEASGEVFLSGGFSVERGASFSVMPSTYR